MRSAPLARSISTRTNVPHIDVYTFPLWLLWVGGNLTLTRSRRSNFPPPLRTASASISARYCSAPRTKRGRGQCWKRQRREARHDERAVLPLRLRPSLGARIARRDTP